MDLWGSDGPNKCTSNAFYGCSRTSNGQNIINPIQSALLRSKAFSLRYGRVEIRARLPKGKWIWPAIWMLPTSNVYGNWPASGEIDIMESRGNDKNYGGEGGSDSFGSTLHWGPDYSQNKFALTHAVSKINSSSDGFHIWGLEWTPRGIKTYIDTPDNVILNVPLGDFNAYQKGGFNSYNPWINSCPQAPFDQQYYLIMNVAGNFHFISSWWCQWILS